MLMRGRGRLVMQTEVAVVDRTKRDEVLPNGRTRPIYWFKVTGETEGESPLRVGQPEEPVH